MEVSAASKPFARLGKHISHSQVSLFGRCELAWWFRYVRGIEKLPTIPMILGKCYHAALAHNFYQKQITGIDLSLEDVVHQYDVAFSEGLQDVVRIPDNVEECRANVERLLTHYYMEYVTGKMEPILVEREFTCSVPGCDRSFAGIIDVQLSDGRMIDFKVSARKWSAADIADDRQSVAYAMLLGYDLDFEFHIAVKANKNPTIQVVNLQRTKEDIRKYVRYLQAVVSRMRDLEYGRAEPIPYEGYCNEKMCQYYSECRNLRYGGVE